MNERVWIYVISRELSQSEMTVLQEKCKNFVSGWTAHEHKLDATFEVYKNRFLIFKVNESAYNASGCSIDKQLRLIKELESEFKIELLNRLLVAYEDGAEVKVVHSSKVKELIDAGKLNENTIVFDNTINSSTQMGEWKKSLKNTWLSKYLPSYSS